MVYLTNCIFSLDFFLRKWSNFWTTTLNIKLSNHCIIQKKKFARKNRPKNRKKITSDVAILWNVANSCDQIPSSNDHKSSKLSSFHNLFSTLWLWFPRRQGHLTNATQHNGYNSINASTLPRQGDSSLPHPKPRRFWAPVLRDHSLQTLLSTVQQLLDAGLIYESRRCLFRALYRVECKQPFHHVQTTLVVGDDDHRVPFRVHGAR